MEAKCLNEVAESKKDTSNNFPVPCPECLQLGLPSDLGEAIKAFEKSLEGLENMVKLFRSDVSKMLDISDSNFPSSPINASLEK